MNTQSEPNNVQPTDPTPNNQDPQSEHPFFLKEKAGFMQSPIEGGLDDDKIYRPKPTRRQSLEPSAFKLDISEPLQPRRQKSCIDSITFEKKLGAPSEELPKPNLSKIEIKIPLKECEICYLEYETLHQPMPGCDHRYCFDCISMQIKSQVEAFNVLKIKCPSQECQKMFSEQQIRHFLNSDDFKNYKDRKLLKERAQNPKLRYCPKPGCARTFELHVNSQQGNFIKCQCGTEICKECFSARHDGKTCLEVSEGELQLMQNNGLQKCIICKTLVEKRVGCNHMFCPVCDYEWCWECGREWAPGHGSRCPKKWSPQSPSRFNNQKSKCKIAHYMCLFIEMLLFYLYITFSIAVFWPCVAIYVSQMMAASCLKKNKAKKVTGDVKVKKPGTNGKETIIVPAAIASKKPPVNPPPNNPLQPNNTELPEIQCTNGGCCFGCLLYPLALALWPFAVLFAPIMALLEEYCVCLRKRRRWTKMDGNGFGLIKKGKLFQNSASGGGSDENKPTDFEASLSENNNNKAQKPEEKTGKEKSEDELQVPGEGDHHEIVIQVKSKNELKF